MLMSPPWDVRFFTVGASRRHELDPGQNEFSSRGDLSTQASGIRARPRPATGDGRKTTKFPLRKPEADNPHLI
jgi:hypothetical protein